MYGTAKYMTILAPYWLEEHIKMFLRYLRRDMMSGEGRLSEVRWTVGPTAIIKMKPF